ncbi:MAG TPA: cysteine desulfurase family protein [Dehalococcoidia bacterium]|nr:cysteine desulfurase family protein [Dehalococcoidia bacterium]
MAEGMRKVYLDHAAATPVLPEALEAMLPYLKDVFGNPTCLHSWGDGPRDAIEESRAKVAALIGASADGIIFTASGSEANNLAIKGIAFAKQTQGKHIVISAVEHFSVLQSCKRLERWGFETTLVPVDKYGMVDPQDVAKSIRKDTILVSVMHANSEVGTIQPIKEIAALVKNTGAAFHTDAVATAGAVPVDVKEMGVDALSLAANKFYGPKGAGALWLRRGVPVIPQVDGGVQEGGRRAGTDNVPGIVGMGKAAEIAAVDLKRRMEHMVPLRDQLIKGLSERIGQVVFTGHPTQRLPDTASFCVRFVEGESMLMHLDMLGIAASSGSSCTSRALKASHVLIAMGLSHEIAQGSLLLTVGKDTQPDDVYYAIEALPPIVDRLRKMSPLHTKFIKEQGEVK